MPEDRSTPALMGDLIESVTQLVRKEIQLFRAEMGEKATQAMVAAGSILAAGVIALTALNVLAAALVAALAKAGLPGAWSAVIVGGVLAIIAYVLARKGINDLKASSLAPERAARAAARDATMVKEKILMAEFHTDPGDRSVSELEREVDQERERVSTTIDELQSRASMGNIVDQLVKAVSENGGEVSRNLGRSLRDNPIAALLTGVGLAWLMAGSGGTSGKESDWDSEDPRYSGGTNPDWRTFGVSGDQTGGSWTGSARSDDDPASSSDGLGQRAADVAGKIGEAVSDTVEGPARSRLRLHARGGVSARRCGERRPRGRLSARHHAGAVRRGAAGTGRDMRQGLDRL